MTVLIFATFDIILKISGIKSNQILVFGPTVEITVHTLEANYVCLIQSRINVNQRVAKAGSCFFNRKIIILDFVMKEKKDF